MCPCCADPIASMPVGLHRGILAPFSITNEQLLFSTITAFNSSFSLHARWQGAHSVAMQQADDLSMDQYLQQRRQHGSSFQDPVHGYAQLGPLAVEFLDTDGVQRLRNLKQLGCASYAFPTAEHSRFVHSVGVGYLAGQCALNLRATGLDVRPTDIELLEVAGRLMLTYSASCAYMCYRRCDLPQLLSCPCSACCCTGC